MELLRRALALDVNYSRAKALLSWVHVIRISAGWAEPDEVSQAIQLAEAVMETDHDDSSTIATAAQILGYIGPDIAVARMAAERALSLSPNSAQVLLAAGWVYPHAGDATAAIDFFQRGIRLSPRDPAMPVFLAGIGMAYLQGGRDEDAIAAFRRQMLLRPNPVPLHGLRYGSDSAWSNRRSACWRGGDAAAMARVSRLDRACSILECRFRTGATRCVSAGGST